MPTPPDDDIESRLLSRLARTRARFGDSLLSLPEPYDFGDLSPFATSAAIYFMDGTSDATVKLRGSGEELKFDFHDESTSIGASSPFVHRPGGDATAYVPAPQPLSPEARRPSDAPAGYDRPTSTHVLQVISMNMRGEDGSSRLLIGLPYAEAHPELFFRKGLLEAGDDAQSYGVVQSLTEFATADGGVSLSLNGYPARSFFSIYHLIETPIGSLFNKRASQMELQPDAEGKLALSLPPIPFLYSLLNGPIPLYDVKEPDGEPLADLVAAHHEGKKSAQYPSMEAWPTRMPDLATIERFRLEGEHS
jgi:hypothetical protein